MIIINQLPEEKQKFNKQYELMLTLASPVIHKPGIQDSFNKILNMPSNKVAHYLLVDDNNHPLLVTGKYNFKATFYTDGYKRWYSKGYTTNLSSEESKLYGSHCYARGSGDSRIILDLQNNIIYDANSDNVTLVHEQYDFIKDVPITKTSSISKIVDPKSQKTRSVLSKSTRIYGLGKGYDNDYFSTSYKPEEQLGHKVYSNGSIGDGFYLSSCYVFVDIEDCTDFKALQNALRDNLMLPSFIVDATFGRGSLGYVFDQPLTYLEKTTIVDAITRIVQDYAKVELAKSINNPFHKSLVDSAIHFFNYGNQSKIVYRSNSRDTISNIQLKAIKDSYSTINTFSMNPLFDQFIPKGSRHDVFMRYYGSMATRIYLSLNGINVLHNTEIAARTLANQLEPEMLNMFDNSDGYVKSKTIISDVKWIFEDQYKQYTECGEDSEKHTRRQLADSIQVAFNTYNKKLNYTQKMHPSTKEFVDTYATTKGTTSLYNDIERARGNCTTRNKGLLTQLYKMLPLFDYDQDKFLTKDSNFSELLATTKRNANNTQMMYNFINNYNRALSSKNFTWKITRFNYASVDSPVDDSNQSLISTTMAKNPSSIAASLDSRQTLKYETTILSILHSTIHLIFNHIQGYSSHKEVYNNSTSILRMIENKMYEFHGVDVNTVESLLVKMCDKVYNDAKEFVDSFKQDIFKQLSNQLSISMMTVANDAKNQTKEEIIESLNNSLKDTYFESFINIIGSTNGKSKLRELFDDVKRNCSQAGLDANNMFIIIQVLDDAFNLAFSKNKVVKQSFFGYIADAFTQFKQSVKLKDLNTFRSTMRRITQPYSSFYCC